MQVPCPTMDRPTLRLDLKLAAITAILRRENNSSLSARFEAGLIGLFTAQPMLKTFISLFLGVI